MNLYYKNTFLQNKLLIVLVFIIPSATAFFINIHSSLKVYNFIHTNQGFLAERIITSYCRDETLFTSFTIASNGNWNISEPQMSWRAVVSPLTITLATDNGGFNLTRVSQRSLFGSNPILVFLTSDLSNFGNQLTDTSSVHAQIYFAVASLLIDSPISITDLYMFQRNYEAQLISIPINSELGSFWLNDLWYFYNKNFNLKVVSFQFVKVLLAQIWKQICKNDSIVNGMMV